MWRHGSKYILIRCGQMQQKKIEIKNKLTNLTSCLKLFLNFSCNIKLFYQICLIYLIT